MPPTLDELESIPKRIIPYILMTKLDDPVLLVSGPFRLIGSSDARLHADLRFRWSPRANVEFEGTYERRPFSLIEDDDWTLVPERDSAFTVPVQLTEATFGTEGSFVRGITADSFSIGDGPFEALRFCLVNFPDYLGKSMHYDCEGRQGWMLGRLETSAEGGCCQLDKIPEVKELVKAAERDAGFVISHVGMWVPSSGVMSTQEAESILGMLHFWFGMLRGSWTGPLLPQGINAEESVVWRQFGHWKLRESQQVTTWLPSRKPLDLSSAFQGFVRRWQEESVWRDPLMTSISWYVEANTPGTSNESRIVLSQVALELLSWVLLVESQRLHHPKDFAALSAAGRIRALLHHIGVSTTIPDYLNRLPSLCDADAFDGPGVITKVRNALVHSNEKKRKIMESVDGGQRMECAELALQYLELALLAVCGHDGHYARRGWRGWKGDDEVLVPWSNKG